MISAMVQNLLGRGPVGTCARNLWLMCMTACVFPLPTETDTSDVVDAPPKNADPVIADSQPTMPGPLTLTSTTQTFSVTLRDADIKDTLYVRLFRNYPAGLGPIDEQAVQNDPTNGKELRAPVTFNTTSWCQPSSAFAGTQLIIDVMVADRMYDPDIRVTPQYRHILDPAGKANIRSWVVTCPVP
jgi:hypothetical protein